MHAAASASIVVIGASVRGTSLVERLLASAPDLLEGLALTVHVVDPYPPGSGRIWRAGQTPHLVMNTVAAQSTLFVDATVACEGPQRTGPNLAQWCRLVVDEPRTAGPDAPPEVVAEAHATSDWSNPSRLLYGHYLRWCFAEILGEAPAAVAVEVHVARAVDLRPTSPGFVVALDTGAAVDADAVILATGWLGRDDIPAHPRVIAPDNPIDQDLSVIAPGETVAVRGLGMGFFDTLSQLTEQRGGRFEPGPGDTVAYIASGQEPHIIAGSRRGIPYRAKPDFGAPPFFPEQRVLRAALPALIERRPVDFGVEVLPLIERDAAYDYYRALDRVRPGSVRDLDGMLRAIVEGTAPVDVIAEAHGVRVADRLSLRAAEDPLSAGPGSSVDEAVARFVRADAAEAALGLRSPLKLALHSYAAARSAVIDLVAFGGLTPASFAAYRRFLATAASFGSGPPLRRSRQLLAAHDAGLLRFTGPDLSAHPQDDHVRIGSSDGGEARADWLVEAWLPTPSVERTGDPLLGALVRRGLARPWRFADGSVSDALDIRPEDGGVLGADGTPAPGLFSVGVPHEDVRVFTIIAPVPGTNSSVLRETDAAARAALRAAVEHATASRPKEART
ncbi:hypothetical protein ASD65_15915 [Microbacterium sp. Root61]|uniref:FAD/NAD(P)-binding protein n=1 Tax=Microbacterium sp. Root61 TaxID=1736570 RepID=UPI0006F68E5C|nr:FAD/NAD(P)-binding protein [Microbacterium sp. Root61]KRA25742.1 hypothetical protein ASD65_15915 [Microbacterium sp. Root61]